MPDRIISKMRKPAYLLFGCTILCAGLTPAPVWATDQDTQFWGFLVADIEAAEDIRITAELSPRLREGDDQLLTRANLEHKLSKAISIGGGIAYVESAGGDEWRPHQQVNVALGPVSLRTRVEERFFDDADRPQIRLRQRVQVTEGIGPSTRLLGSVELLYALQSAERGGDAQVDSWRFDATIRQRLSPRIDASIGYRAILAPRGAAEDRLSHVPHLTIQHKF